jgi:CO/xanthine dehydrogenase FAD-binding subunit
MLHAATRFIGDPPIRNRGSVGGARKRGKTRGARWAKAIE